MSRDGLVANNSLDLGNIFLFNPTYQDATLSIPSADTYAEGTLLARQTVDIAITPSAVTGTGDGTVTVASVVAGSIVPLAGSYVLTCTLAVTNGGIFKLVDPNGAIVNSYIELTVGAGAATIVEAGGMIFTITDGATDFVAADFFTLPVVANGDLVAYAVAGAGGAQIPLAILPVEVITTGASDEPIQACVGGEYVLSRLVIDADGDASNIDAAIIDQLRDYGLIAQVVTENNFLDNA